jgi:hypothetical protein
MGFSQDDKQDRLAAARGGVGGAGGLALKVGFYHGLWARGGVGVFRWRIWSAREAR